MEKKPRSKQLVKMERQYFLTMFIVAVVLMSGMLVLTANILALFSLPAYAKLLIGVLVLIVAGLITIWIAHRNMLQYFLNKFRAVEK